MIKVLIVDDSPTVIQYLTYILNNDSNIEVIGSARNGEEAIDFVNRTKPDIITMDIDMPKMDGIETIKRIMTDMPIPIMVVTSKRNLGNRDVSIEALAMGALTVVYKPVGVGHVDEDEYSRRLLYLIKVYAKVKVVKRKFSGTGSDNYQSSNKDKEAILTTPVGQEFYNKKYVAIGVSTGGPKVLEEILSQISDKFPYPIFVVQHITVGFLENMVSWLNRLLSIPVSIASNNEIPLPGHVYFAPDNFHMGVVLNKLILYQRKDKSEICPSAEFLFNSLADNYGKETIAMLLTGMGSDGAEEIKKMKDNGAVTIAQDKKSSLIHGMPGKAIQLGGVKYILNTNQITNLLSKIEKQNDRIKQTLK